MEDERQCLMGLMIFLLEFTLLCPGLKVCSVTKDETSLGGMEVKIIFYQFSICTITLS